MAERRAEGGRNASENVALSALLATFGRQQGEARGRLEHFAHAFARPGRALEVPSRADFLTNHVTLNRVKGS